MQKTKGGFSMIIAGTASYLFMGAMYVWSVIRIELTKLFPSFTASQMSLTFTLMMICFCLGGFAGGRLTERKDPGFSLKIASVLILAGYEGASLMEFCEGGAAFAVLCLFLPLFAGFGIGIGYNACMANISPWFPAHVGLVTGILMMGFGMSSLVFAFVIGAVCPHIGIFNVLRALGAMIFLVVFVSSFFVKKPPVTVQAAPDGGDAGCNDCTVRQMVSRPSFWIYFLWNTLCGAAGLLVINNAANIAAYFGLAAGLGLIVSLFNGCGRPVVGAIVDRFGRFRSMFIMIFMLLLAALMLVYADRSGQYAFMFAGLILVGIVYGGGNTISVKVIRELYGARHFGVNHSIANFCVMAAAVAGPLLSGLLQDKSGGFTSTFIMLLMIALAALALIFLLIAAVKWEEKRR